METTTTTKRKVHPNSLANLRPQSVRTKSEQRKIAQKAGRKSGESRRKKATQRDIIRNLLKLRLKDLPLSPEKVKMICDSAGVDPSILLSEASVCTIIEEAILNRNHHYIDILLRADGSLDRLPSSPQEGSVNFVVNQDSFDIIERLKQKAQLDSEEEHHKNISLWQ